MYYTIILFAWSYTANAKNVMCVLPAQAPFEGGYSVSRPPPWKMGSFSSLTPLGSLKLGITVVTHIMYLRTKSHESILPVHEGRELYAGWLHDLHSRST